MAARFSSMISALALPLILPVAVQAQTVSGDIVDQVLQTMPQRGPASPPPVPYVAPSPYAAPPAYAAPAPAVAPSSSMTVATPTRIAPSPGGGDVVNQALQTMPARPAPLVPAPPQGPPVVLPASALASPGGGDVVDQVTQVPPTRSVAASALPWTGVYFGANIGGGSSRGGSGVSCANSQTNTASGCPTIGNGGLNTSGPLGGGQVGYMAPVYLGQDMPLLLGAEIDLQGTGFSGSQNNNGPFPFVGFPGITCSPCGYSASQSLDWFSTVRGRIGIPLDSVLLYGTGGVIVGGVRTTQSLAFGSQAGYVASGTSTLAGPVVGGGVEVLIPGGLPLSAKIEALYYDLGTVRTTTTPQNGFGDNFSFQKEFGLQGGIIRAGINFHLGNFGAF